MSGNRSGIASLLSGGSLPDRDYHYQITIESGQLPADDPKFKKNPRGKYKTRVDREFCKGRGCKQKYHYRKKAGWSGYD